jgi:hypothetical protein
VGMLCRYVMWICFIVRCVDMLCRYVCVWVCYVVCYVDVMWVCYVGMLCGYVM